MSGGQINWSTNLPQVATEIQTALRKIKADTQAMGQAGSGGQNFMAGFEARLARVGQQMQQQLHRIGEDFERQAQRQAKKGGAAAVTGRDSSGRTVQQATRPAVDQALNQIKGLTTEVAHALPAQMAPLRNQINRQLSVASNQLVTSYRDTVQDMTSVLNREARALGASRDPYRTTPTAGGQKLEQRARGAAVPTPMGSLDKRELTQMQSAMSSLTSEGGRLARETRQAQRAVGELNRETARRIAADLRTQRVASAQQGGRDPRGAGRVSGVPGVRGGNVWFDAQGQPHSRAEKLMGGGLRELDTRELEPQDRALLEQKRAQQIATRQAEMETEARKENIQRTREQSRAVYENVQQQVRQGQAFAVGGGRKQVVQGPGGVYERDTQQGTARQLAGDERIQAERRIQNELGRIQGEAQKENTRRTQQALVESERSTYRQLTQELGRQEATRSQRGVGREVRSASGDVYAYDPKKERAQRLQGQQAADANARVDKELARKGQEQVKAREAQTKAAQRETRQWLESERSQQRAQRSGRFARHSGGGTYALEGRGQDARARRLSSSDPRDMAELAEAERALARSRKDAARQSRRAIPPPIAAGPAGGGRGGGGPIDKIFAGMSGEDGGRGLRGGDIFGSMMQYSRYFLASGAIIGIVTALRAAKEAVIDYRESMTDLEVALGETGRATAPFISGLSDIARFAGENTGAAIDSAVRGVRAFTQETPENTEMPGVTWSMGPLEFTGFGQSEYQEEAEAIGTQVAETAQQLAVIAEKSLEDATGDVISIGFAFGLDEAGASVEAGFSRITDSIAIAKRQFSGDSSEIAQGLSSFAAVASEAGFTMEESANIISLVQARTDQSGRAVATRLSRMTSIIGGSAGRSAIEKLNTQLQPEQQIDTTGSVRDQLMQISSIYDVLSQQQQNMIRNAMGGTANVRELIPILQSPDELREGLDAQFENVGAGLDEFQRKARDLAGTLRRLSGDVQGIVTALFEAGLGDIFLLGLQSIEPFTNALRTLLHTYNRIFDIMNSINLAGRGMGDWIQTAIMLFAQLKAASFLWGKAAMHGMVPDMAKGAGAAAASKQFSGVQGTLRTSVSKPTRAGMSDSWMTMMAMMGLGGGRMGFGRTGPKLNRQQRAWQGLKGNIPGAGGTGIDAQMADRLDFANTRMSALSAATLSMGESASRAMSKMRNFVNANPLLFIAGGLVAISRAWDSAQAALKGTEDAFASLGEVMPEASAMGIRDFAQDQRSAAEETRQAVGGLFGWMTDALQGFQGRAAANMLDTRAIRANEFAGEFEEEQRKHAQTQRDPADMIRADTAESVGESLDILSEEGRSAITQADALSSAIARMADQAEQTSRSLNELELFQFAFDLADSLRSEMGTETDMRMRSRLREPSMGFMGSNWRDLGRSNRQMEDIQDAVGDEDFQARMDEQLRQYVQSMGSSATDPAMRGDLVDWMVEQYVTKMEQDGKEVTDNHREALRGAATLAVANTVSAWENVEDPLAAMQVAQQAVEAQRAARDEREVRMRAGVESDLGQGSEVAATQHHLRDLQRDRANLVRQAEVGGFDAGPALEQMDHEILEIELTLVEQRRERIQSMLELQKSEMSSGAEVAKLDAELQAVRRELEIIPQGDTVARDEAKARENELRQQRKRAEQARGASETQAGIDPRDTVALAESEVTATRDLLTLIESLPEGKGSQEYWDTYGELQQKKIDLVNEEDAYTNAQEVAALDPRDTLGQALQAVTAAERKLDNAIEGTIAYEEAQAEYNQKVHDLNQLRLRAAQAWRLADVDPRDTLGQINAEIENAKENFYDALPGSEEQANAAREMRQLAQRRTDEQRSQQQAQRQSRIDPRARRRRIESDLQSAQEDLNAAFGGSQAEADARERVAQARMELAEFDREAADAQRRAAIDPRDTRRGILADIQQARAEIRGTLAGTPERWNAMRDLREAELELAQHDREYAAARRAAQVDPDSQTQRAVVDMQNARDALRGELAGTVEYQRALGDYRQAQVGLADAILKEQSLLRQLDIDLTDPVATAQEELRSARARLRQAQGRGAPQDVLAEREVDVRNAEAQAEQAAFQQRMSDAQIANDLGRMSHQAYIRYLEDEGARLRSIQDRTRQQQDQLNEVDRALKAASEQMEAQWNIGDINIPTPYEVRRSIEAQAQGITADAMGIRNITPSQSSAQHIENTILVNGADTAEVTKILKQILGPEAMGKSSTGASGARRL